MEKPVRIFIPFKWEQIPGSDGTSRAKVIGGWLILDQDGNSGNCMTFVPDPEHFWIIQQTPQQLGYMENDD